MTPRAEVRQPDPTPLAGTVAGGEEWENLRQLKCLLCLYLLCDLGASVSPLWASSSLPPLYNQEGWNGASRDHLSRVELADLSGTVPRALSLPLSHCSLGGLNSYFSFSGASPLTQINVILGISCLLNGEGFWSSQSPSLPKQRPSIPRPSKPHPNTPSPAIVPLWEECWGVSPTFGHKNLGRKAGDRASII